ncbi:MAG TPA: class I SAM-dependent methyltransferase [Solirubrobacteraceae bacterium]|nr:class I SAM-dependent methyltransferase [Solirubrobacteraceae bacterium]
MVAVVQNVIAEEATPSGGSAAWARAFAVLYDPFLWVAEWAGLRARRKELLSRARGCTVEIGVGTGLNVPHYPDGLSELVLVEPDAAMRSRLDKKLRRSGQRARLIDATAERLPFADGSVDTIVSTFVLCTVDAPDLALREIARVLRPDGELLFIEHVRSDSPTLAYWQDRLAKPWRCFAQGCRCNRATAELIVTCGLELQHVRKASWHAMPPIVRPLIAGRARSRGATDSAQSSAHRSPTGKVSSGPCAQPTT